MKDFKNETEKKMNKDYKGFLNENYLLFIDENKKIRNLTQLSYRILSFIFYSNLFFQYILGNIQDNDLKDKVPFEEQSYNGTFTGSSSSKDESSGNWEIYRIPILEKRKTQKNEKPSSLTFPSLFNNNRI